MRAWVPEVPDSGSFFILFSWTLFMALLWDPANTPSPGVPIHPPKIPGSPYQWSLIALLTVTPSYQCVSPFFVGYFYLLWPPTHFSQPTLKYWTSRGVAARPASSGTQPTNPDRPRADLGLGNRRKPSERKKEETWKWQTTFDFWDDFFFYSYPPWSWWECVRGSPAPWSAAKSGPHGPKPPGGFGTPEKGRQPADHSLLFRQLPN